MADKTKNQLKVGSSNVENGTADIRTIAKRDNQYKLINKKDLFFSLIDKSPFPIVIFSPDSTTEYLNPKFKELFGYNIEVISDRFKWRKKAYPDANYRKETIREIAASESAGKLKIEGVERRITCADGSIKDGILYSMYLPDGRYSIIIVDVTEKKKIQNALDLSMNRFKTVYKNAPVPAFLWQREGDDYALIDYSQSAEEFTKANVKNRIGSKLRPLFEDMPEFIKDTDRCFAEQAVVRNEYLYRLRNTDKMRYVSSFYTFIPPDFVLIHIVDITEHKTIERSLKEKEKKLETEAKKLEEANTALKVLLDYRVKEKKRIQENVFTTIIQLIFPFLEKLMNGPLNEEQKILVNVIKSNLDEITSPFATKLSYKYAGLTPSEFAVANLVRDGRSIKESADVLNVSDDTIRFHRKNIRIKLGLKNKRINLHSYLQQVANE